MKILIACPKLDETFQALVDRLRQTDTVLVCGHDNMDLTDVDLFVSKRVSLEALNKANRLQAIFTYQTGVDSFPLDELKKRNIQLFNSHINASVVAAFALGLAFSITCQIPQYDYELRRGKWSSPSSSPGWANIFDMKVGLVGFGHIGQAINQALVKLGIPTYTIDRQKQYSQVHLVPNKESLFETCDLLFFSLPKTKQTDNFITEELLKAYPGRYLVNVGRENIISQKLLYESLRNRTIKGAAIDTWGKRPSNLKNIQKVSSLKFESLDNIIMTPHVAISVRDSMKRYILDVADVIQAYKQGNKKNQVELSKGY